MRGAVSVLVLVEAARQGASALPAPLCDPSTIMSYSGMDACQPPPLPRAPPMGPPPDAPLPGVLRQEPHVRSPVWLARMSIRDGCLAENRAHH